MPGVLERCSFSHYAAMWNQDVTHINRYEDCVSYISLQSSCALVHPGASVIHEACSKFNTSQFQAERGNFQTSLSNVLKERFTKMHADVTDLQVKCSHGLCVETGQFHSKGVISVRLGRLGGKCVCVGGGGGELRGSVPMWSSFEGIYIYLKFCEAEVFSHLGKMVVSFQAQLKWDP